MEVGLLQHQLKLLLGKVEVDHGQRDGVKGQIPRRIPRVLPLVRHRDDVFAHHVEPVAVAHGAVSGERVDPVLAEPSIDVKAVELLAPQHARERLTHDETLIVCHARRRDRRVERIGLSDARGKDLVEIRSQAVRPWNVRHAGETQPQNRRLLRANGHAIASRHLRACACRIHRFANTADHEAMNGIFYIGRAIRYPSQALEVRLVLGEQQLGIAFARQYELPQIGVDDAYRRDPGDSLEQRLLPPIRPRPRVAEPERGEHVERPLAIAPVVQGDAHQDVMRGRLCVLDERVEVAIALEDARVDELVLHVALAASAVLAHEIVVGIGLLRILVEVLHVGVGGRAVEVVVVLLDVLAVVALAIGEAEETLLDDRVAPVPQRQRKAQPLLVVGDAGQAVLAPAVDARSGLIMAEVLPGITGSAVVLAHRTPLTLREVGPPGLPGHAALALLGQSLVFCCDVRLVWHGVTLCLRCARLAAVRPPTVEISAPIDRQTGVKGDAYASRERGLRAA